MQLARRAYFVAISAIVCADHRFAMCTLMHVTYMCVLTTRQITVPASIPLCSLNCDDTCASSFQCRTEMALHATTGLVHAVASEIAACKLVPDNTG